MKQLYLTIILILFLSNYSFGLTKKPNTLSADGLNEIHQYITRSWITLRRSVSECQALRDKLTQSSNILYLPYGMKLSNKESAAIHSCGVKIVWLPKKIQRIGELDVANLPMGLLYLPKPYVVPGGMFNEMYGWDSYFIMLGLLADHKLEAAHDMLENIFFEINNYGGILNANRSYYLTRSQPPFLTSMIRAIYDALPNPSWLAEAYEYAVKDYKFWTSGAHLAGNTGLSRYHDFATGPVPELSHPDNHYYADVAHELSTRYKQATPLSAHFYAGDRAMRESGFDTSFRFGPFSGHTTDYASVDLNSLLFKAEKDLAWMSRKLNRPAVALQWEKKAHERMKKMNRYLWNAEKGLYFDYDFKHKKQSQYVFVTTYYPLWVQAASDSQAKSVVDHLEIFERKGGLLTSPYLTGAQWDAPYGWAPLQYISVKGLYLYHYNKQADRIAKKFLGMVLQNFLADKTIHEKYDVIQAKSKTWIKFGYTKNMVGFGWTNGVFLALLNLVEKK